MEPSADTVEIITCIFLILVSLIGNTLLIYSTRRCSSRGLQTSFVLIFSLAFDHLIKNLVVNVMKVAYSSGGMLDSAGCKVLRFTEVLTTTLSIWFMLYLALLYCRKLDRIIHPLNETGNSNHRKNHLRVNFLLWAAGIVVCIPILAYSTKSESMSVGNDTLVQFTSVLYENCKIDFENVQLDYYYEKIFLICIDLLPLIISVLICFHIFFLLSEQKKATYGDIWIGEDPSEVAILRGAKLSISLVFLITALWISHFILVCFLKNLEIFYFVPAVLTVLSSGFSAISPYLLMLIHYKVKLEFFSCSKKGKATPQSSSIIVSPYS
ncbi:uncharacterized protein LOC114807860 [Ornithorhynchus anatinus]|uniref:uncharacterized protein LOC114807860 n=1 Tax=Ornithorhynchus anatinus TaxID=9258 RepID=UPI0010A75EBC|nr:uncharacterized protein LOC114807860 [Ornithorhynchus anatinus]